LQSHWTRTISILLCIATFLLWPILLDAATSKPEKPALEAIVLGSGGPRAFGRAGSSYLILLDGTPRILVDAGPGAFLRIGELELDLERVDTVLLTHLHIDHSSDLPAFFNARALTSDGPISYRIFGPAGAGSRAPRTLSTRLSETPAPFPIRRPSAHENPLRFTT
jgi:ribonuclease BN (tRNA processing enzyme)